MKNISLIFIVLVSFLFFSCPFGASVEDITVQNVSDYEVTDIVLKYHHGTKGERTERIAVLQSGERKTLSVVTQDMAIKTMTTSVVIEYLINGIKFGENNALSEDKYGLIGAGVNTKFTIKNEGYYVEDVRE